MSEQTASITLHAGDTLTRSDGATAEVRAVEMSNRDKKNVVFGYKIFIAEPGEEARIALITVADLPGFLRTWQLQQPDGQPVLESAPVAAHPDAPSASPSLLAERGLGGEVDPALIVQLRAEIAALTERNTFLESRLDGLVESRDSACDQLDAADSRIESLTEQLAAARAELASLKSAVPVPAANVLAAPGCREEVKTLFHKMSSPALRDEADAELAVCLNDQWQKFDCTIVSNDGHIFRVVTLTRSISTPPVGAHRDAPASVKPVGPQVTILPTTNALPSRHPSFEEHMADVLETGREVYKNALKDSLVPTYRPLTSLPAGGSK